MDGEDKDKNPTLVTQSVLQRGEEEREEEERGEERREEQRSGEERRREEQQEQGEGPGGGSLTSQQAVQVERC